MNATQTVQFLRKLISLMTFFAFLAVGAQASINVCTERPQSAFIEVGYASQTQESLDYPSGAISNEFSSLHFMFQGLNTESATWFLGFEHQYTIFDIENLSTQTNGHQHTVSLPFYYYRSNPAGRLQVSLAPALSISSNILKDPDLYNSDAVQGLGSIIYAPNSATAVNWLMGLCADHRYGSFRVYPLLGFQWNIKPDWQAVIAYPDTEMSHSLSDTIQWQLRVGPDGNQWYVKDKELGQSSDFTYEAYLAEWQIEWLVVPEILLAASIGWVFDTKYRFALDTDEHLNVKAEDSTQMKLFVQWRF